ncbi:MAG: hypothetical protein PWP23_1823 [Candidatus Sumerlaeota bacterium]|nr:hypothetical protein [Candidatus Sumerlaeota bacterium]
MTFAIHRTALVLSLALGSSSLALAQSGTKQPAPPPAESSATKAETRARVAPTAEAATPLKPGDKVPETAPLRRADGQSVSLSQLLENKSAVIVFYRGGWCPYCNAHLADLARIQPVLAENDVALIAISPDSPSALSESLSSKPLPYTLLSDSNHEAMKAFGVAFAVDPETQNKLKGHGMDLTAASGNQDAVLPVPSVFVVNPGGKVTFAHTDADYRQRLSGEQVLKAAGISPKASGSATKHSDGDSSKEHSEHEGSGTK